MDKIVANRNLVLDYIRKHVEYDYVLMVDSDILPPNNILSEFLRHKKDILCGLCFVRALDGIDVRPALNFFPADIKSGKPAKWMAERKPRLVKIAQNGMGCFFIKADILRKHKDLNFYNKTIRRGGKAVTNEDLTFTDNLRKLGYDLLLDLEMECFHDMKGRF